MSDEPIQEMDYVGGVTVVDIGDLRVARGMTRRPASSCRHHRLVYDQKERRVWCKDCEKDVDAFDAFLSLVERYDGATKKLQRDRDALDEAAKFQARLVATKTIDQAWRSRTMVPCCPSCGNGLMPEDFRTDPAMISKEFAEARRGKLKR